MGLNLKQNSGFLIGFGFVCQDRDSSVWMETVDDAGAGGGTCSQAFVADGHATVRSDFHGGARASDVRPP